MLLYLTISLAAPEERGDVSDLGCRCRGDKLHVLEQSIVFVLLEPQFYNHHHEES
jgi:hypothetical protein